MGMKREKYFKSRTLKNSIKADVIILGCSLPGIVTAHKLKMRFGDSMDIVVLDLALPTRVASKSNVAFDTEILQDNSNVDFLATTDDQRHVHLGKFYLTKHALDLNIPIPTAIIGSRPEEEFAKIFQHLDGTHVTCDSNFHDFNYLNYLERFELRQYQSLLDESMQSLFRTHITSMEQETKLLRYYDQTSMEQHISSYLLFDTSKEIMRTTVKLACGATPTKVSVLFFLHQCFRTQSCMNHLDGDNTRLREKLMGYFRNRISSKLQQSVADITLRAKPIKEIRTYSDEEVILETMLGETNYICNLLAMALSPDQLRTIRVEAELLQDHEFLIKKRMLMGKIKRFTIQYERNIWREKGYSGDIVSIRGPILWAIERPQLAATGAQEKYASLIGYLNNYPWRRDSKDLVVDQLVMLFGEDARDPKKYTERSIHDLCVPDLGDYTGLYKMSLEETPKYLEWAALDIFAEGDMAASIEAGHRAYLHLMSTLRPQARTYDDEVVAGSFSTVSSSPIARFMRTTGIRGGLQAAAIGTGLLVGLRLMYSYLRR